eukprot:COSAG03_NODE_16114_length_411_cov_0.996795_2_plen_111_part_00
MSKGAALDRVRHGCSAPQFGLSESCELTQAGGLFNEFGVFIIPIHRQSNKVTVGARSVGPSRARFLSRVLGVVLIRNPECMQPGAVPRIIAWVGVGVLAAHALGTAFLSR